jgi:hypothetical protein
MMRLQASPAAFISTFSTSFKPFLPKKACVQATPFFGSDRPSQKTLDTRPLYQGNTNGCGTTSLAMALNLLNSLKPPSSQRQTPFTRELLDTGTREWDSYASVSTLQQAARRQQFFAEVYPNLSFETLAKHLANNEPIIALINPVPARLKDDSALHYVLIDGYNDNRNSQKPPNRPRIRFTDPALKSNATQWIDFETFKTDYWQTKTWRGFPIGATQVGLVLSNTSNSLPKGPPLNLQFQVAAAANDLINQAAQWFKNWRQ